MLDMKRFRPVPKALQTTSSEPSKAVRYLVILLLAGITIFAGGNLFVRATKERIVVNPQDYRLRDGFPVFTSADAYLKLVKTYRYNFGTTVTIHRIQAGETYWDIAHRHNISLETIIGANPHLPSLAATEGLELVIPSENGVLFPIDDAADAVRMLTRVGNPLSMRVKGDFRQGVFDLLSLDDIRFVFIKNAKPRIVGEALQDLYDIRMAFAVPVRGQFTSFFGVRNDPIYKEATFHNGVDIRAPTGTPIRPLADGMVSRVGWNEGYGLSVFVLHRNGYETMYGHCSVIRVAQGDMVTKNDIIAEVGSTGRSTGSHLHFVVKRHGQLVDPLLFIW